MTMEAEFTDAELTAFLDGEASSELATRIEASRDDALAERLARLDLGRDMALAGFAEAIRHAPSMPLDMQPSAPSMPPMRMAWPSAAMGLAAGLLLAVVAGAFWTYGGSKVEPWHREVAAYHALYVTETLTSARPDPALQVATVQSLSELVGRDLGPAVQTTDMDFRRAQQLGFEGAPLIQMAYLAPGGVPVALCILRVSGAPQGVEVNEVQGMSAASWSDGDLRFILIGGTDADAIARRAMDLAERLNVS